jgi:hypothetical protein
MPWFLGCVGVSQPDPTGELPVTTAKPPARYGAIGGARSGGFALPSYTTTGDTTATEFNWRKFGAFATSVREYCNDRSIYIRGTIQNYGCCPKPGHSPRTESSKCCPQAWIPLQSSQKGLAGTSRYSFSSTEKGHLCPRVLLASAPWLLSCNLTSD